MEFTHFNSQGESHMVDVTDKTITKREAVARGTVYMEPATMEQIYAHRMAKGDVLEVARLAGIMGAKQTSQLIPLCHPLFITGVEIGFTKGEASIQIEATAKTSGQTGVEMEALTAVSIAALTIYDMCKAIDKRMVLSDIRLMQKTGGKSGTFKREENNG
jgi:cyclic pyranopterin monophosphate synthase